ncbi:Interferon-induced protein with tetratricopeptide repeats 1 [Tupaia chinensis]|uniref:Interferon-induced protein with tetratricopeptide repeats 1 n=1 Tax=Tupaia chinensis TaxID=246437 RepID=L9KW28_TUPCH|nr:Interferon-induced protein with tetratricopeptide repeats 1 [Tupaia chinensis]
MHKKARGGSCEGEKSGAQSGVEDGLAAVDFPLLSMFNAFISTAARHNKKADDRQIKDRLEQLRCPFTWNLLIEDSEVPNLENRVLEQLEFLDNSHNARTHNLLAYVKHLNGQNEEALECLKKAEDLIQKEYADHLDRRSLVTWGNYAWVYYHMGRLAEAQTYLDKVEKTCKKFSSPFCYRMEDPWMDSDEGWALLKCGGRNYGRAKACFEKALEVDPDNPEFSAGYAITTYRLEGFNPTTKYKTSFSLQPLRRALKLNPENVYVKVLLALKLQDVGKKAEGEKLLEEALSSQSSQIYVFRYAAKFYRRKGCLDKALQLLKMALEAAPTSAILHHQIGLCYKEQLRKSRGKDPKQASSTLRLAIAHFEAAVKEKPTFGLAYLDLANMYTKGGEYQKAEDTYQKVLSLREVNKSLLQQIHFRYDQFQERHRKPEGDARACSSRGLNVDRESDAQGKIVSALEKLSIRPSSE